MSDAYDTTKTRVGLYAELVQAEKDFAEHPSLENMEKIRYLRNKVEFYASPDYQQYKKANEARP